MLLAANHEIAKTAEVVSEPMLGRIRLQWWRESLDGIQAGSARHHEVVTPLAALASDHPEILPELRTVIDAREADLENAPPDDEAALLRYLEDTAGALHGLFGGILDVDPDIAKQTGVAWGLVGTLMSLPHLVAVQRQPLPHSLLKKSSISYSYLNDHSGHEELSDALAPLVEEAKSRVDTARATLSGSAARPLRLMMARASDHLQVLERAGNDPYKIRIPAPDSRLVWRHWRRSLLDRVGIAP